MKKYLLCLATLVLSVISGCNKSEEFGDRLEITNLEEFEASDLFMPQGGDFPLCFYSSGEWYAEVIGDGDVEWLSLDKTSGGKGDTALQVSTDINDTKEDRSVTIRLKSRDLVRDVAVTQSSSTVIEKLSESRFSVTSDSQEISTELRTGYGEPDVQTSVEWISLKSVEKVSKINYKITLSVSANSNNDNRTGSVKIISGSNKVYNVSVVQEADRLELLENNVILGCSGGNFNIYVKTNVDIRVEEIPDWVELRKIYDSSVKIVSLHAARNMSDQARSATLKISADGMEALSFEINQEGDIKEDWNSRVYNRRNLIFKFTGTWCGFCPDMSTSLKEITERNPDMFSIISIYNNSENEVNYISRTIQDYYGVNAFPTGIMDGRAAFFNMNTEDMNSTLMSLKEEADELFPSNCSADMESVIENGKLKVNMTVYCYRPGDYKIALAIVEDNVKAYQNGADEGKNYLHDHVLRKFLTDELGDDLVFEKSSSIELEYEIPVPGNVMNPDNCKVIAYLMQKIPYMHSFVDGTDNLDKEYFVDNVIESEFSE